MGLMDKLANKMEKSMSKNLTGESKEQYEKEQQAKAQKQEEATKAKAEIDVLAMDITKEDLKDFNALIKRSNFVDQSDNWIAGFPNFKANYNAVIGNLITGKKNIKVLTQKEDTFYLLSILNNKLSAYKAFTKSDVTKVETASKLLSKSFKIKFSDGQSFSIDVTINKDKIKFFKGVFS